jgi:hypothetical protein
LSDTFDVDVAGYSVDAIERYVFWSISSHNEVARKGLAFRDVGYILCGSDCEGFGGGLTANRQYLRAQITKESPSERRETKLHALLPNIGATKKRV